MPRSLGSDQVPNFVVATYGYSQGCNVPKGTDESIFLISSISIASFPLKRLKLRALVVASFGKKIEA